MRVMRKNNLPLDSKNIVITRSENKISAVRDLFQKKGATIFNLPAIIIDYPDDLRPLDEALSEISNFHWIIFSSANGVEFVDNRLKYLGTSLLHYSKFVKIAVVGEKTSQALQSLGITSDYIPPDFIAESLIDNFPLSGYGLNILLPRVQTGGRSIIADQFRNAGAMVTEVAAYESKCPQSIPENTRNALKNNTIDAIIFSSGKTVNNSAFLLKKYFGKEWLKVLDNVFILTIGPQTSKKCFEVFGRVDKESENYTFEGLLEATLDVFDNFNQ